MKFWKNLIDNLKKILDSLESIYKQIKDLNDLLFLHTLKLSDVSNENPIKEIKTFPLLILEHNANRKKLVIQNIGLEPCYIKLDKDIDKEDFHFALAPDTSPAFGNGGSVTLDNWHGKVYAIADKATKISVLEY